MVETVEWCNLEKDSYLRASRVHIMNYEDPSKTLCGINLEGMKGFTSYGTKPATCKKCIKYE